MATGVFGRVKEFENMDVSARRFLASGAPVLPNPEFLSGTVFYVNSGLTAAGDGRSPEGAVATITAGLALCTTGANDKLVVMPGHAENISAAAGIAISKSGVALIGLGRGTARPTLTWTAAAATLSITAANVAFVNFRFVNNFADVVTMFDVSGAGDDLTFDSCQFTDTSTILNAVDFITLATGADGLSILNCQVVGKSASNDSFITGVAHDRIRIANSQIQFDVAQTAAVGVIETSGNATNVWIKDCAFRSNVDGALFLDFNGTANSGLVTNCYFSSIDIAGAVTAGFDFTGGHFFECYVAGEDDTYGIIGGGAVYNNA
jgi:hypothetical protein